MQTIYMSTSTFQNCVEILLNAGCFENRVDAEETAARHFEHVFPVTIGDQLGK